MFNVATALYSCSLATYDHDCHWVWHRVFNTLHNAQAAVCVEVSTVKCPYELFWKLGILDKLCVCCHWEKQPRAETVHLHYMIQSVAEEGRVAWQGKEKETHESKWANGCRLCSILEQNMFANDLSFVTVESTVTPSSVAFTLEEILYTVNPFSVVWSWQNIIARVGMHSPQTLKLNKILLHGCSTKDRGYILCF